MASQRLKIAITGASGRIGTVLRKGLANKYDLTLFVYDIPEAKSESQVDGKGPWKLVKNVDFSDRSQVLGKFAGIDVVIHLAALVDVTPYGEDWEKMRKHNFDATWFVFEECVRSKVKRIVFASSNHVQNGATVENPAETESINFAKLGGRKMELKDEAFPDSMYAVAKLFGEDIGRLCALQSKLECVALRIGWVNSAIVDDPTQVKGTSGEEYMKAMYLSHRDCVGFFDAAITAPIQTPNRIPFVLAYACSKNSKCVWNFEETIKTLGYRPQDSADAFF